MTELSRPYDPSLVMPRPPRSELLPHVGVLLALDVATIVLAPTIAFPILLAASLAYIAHVVLRTRDLARRGGSLVAFDRWILRWCGVLAPAPVVLFLGTAYGLEARVHDVNDAIFGHAVGWAIVAAAFELGLVLAVAAFNGGGRVAHVPPSLLWRSLAVPFAVVYGLYLIGTITRGFGEALGH